MSEATRRFLLSRNLPSDFVDEIVENGITDDVVRKLECRGFSYEDIVEICKVLNDSDGSCHCSSVESEHAQKSHADSDYLRQHFSEILPTALREIIAKKPRQPIEYLGQWLLHHRDCEERERRRKEFEAELLEERAKYPQPTCFSEPQSDDNEEEEEVEGEQHEYIF